MLGVCDVPGHTGNNRIQRSSLLPSGYRVVYGVPGKSNGAQLFGEVDSCYDIATYYLKRSEIALIDHITAVAHRKEVCLLEIERY